MIDLELSKMGKNNASHPVEAEPSKRPRSMIPYRLGSTPLGSEKGHAVQSSKLNGAFALNLFPQLKEKINKLIESGFIREVEISNLDIQHCAHLSPLRKAYLYLHLSAWESPECVSLFLWQKSQPLVMCRVVLEPQSQLLLGGPLVRQNPQGSSSSPIEGFEFQRAFVEHPQEHFAPNIALQLEFQLVYRIMFHKLDLSLNTSFERGNTFSWSFL
nr:hypothetical protein Iba_chr03bCG4300 [Ipomoea batatas]